MSNKRTFNQSGVDVAKTNPRLAKTRISTYMQRDTLTIPQDIKERFLNDGFVLRWVRCNFGVGGQFDLKNIGQRARLGYIPVVAEEVPEFAYFTIRRDVNLPGTADAYDFKDVIIQGDLMLAKCPIENVLEYRQYVWEESQMRTAAVDRKAYDEGLDINESETSYSHGKKRFTQRKGVNFADDL